MASRSSLHSAACRRFLTTAMNSKTMRTLMKDFKCYNMKLKLCISEWYYYSYWLVYLVYEVQVLELIIVTFSFSLWNVSAVIVKVTSFVVLEAWPWPRGSSRTSRHLMKVLALALAFARPRPRLFPKTQATWLLYVYALLLTLTVSHNSLPAAISF